MAVFCYTEKNNKNKSLNGKLFKTKTIIKLSKQTLLFTFLAAYRKDKNNQIRNTKDFYPGFIL